MVEGIDGDVSFKVFFSLCRFKSRDLNCLFLFFSLNFCGIKRLSSVTFIKFLSVANTREVG